MRERKGEEEEKKRKEKYILLKYIIFFKIICKSAKIDWPIESWFGWFFFCEQQLELSLPFLYRLMVGLAGKLTPTECWSPLVVINI